VRLLRRLQRAVYDLGHERLTERNRVALQHAAALAAFVVFLARPHAVERLPHRSLTPARETDRLVHVAVNLDDEVRRVAGLDVQAVDVLRDERMELPALLQRDERQVPGVRLRGKGGMLETALPRRLAHL